MHTSSSPAAAAALPAELLPALLELSVSGVAYYLPVTDAAGEIVDFTIAYLNAAAQQLLGLPPHSAVTFAGHFPQAMLNGGFAFHRDAFLSGTTQERTEVYHAEGGRFFVRAAARRLADGLLVSFATVADADTHVLQEALRQSEERELAAYGEANRLREQLYHLLEQAPAMICVFNGPEHVFQFVNSAYQALVGPRPLVGRPIAEAMPELVGQPVFELLDQVYRTGETFEAREMLVQLDHRNEGRTELEKHYYNFIYQARRTRAGAVDGIFVFAYDVTPQVEARQLIEHQNEELAARVAAAVQANEQQRADQQADLRRIFEVAPVAIAIMRGPELVVELANEAVAAIWGRPAAETLGQPYFEAVPDTAGQGFEEILAGVLRTGQPLAITEAPVTLDRAHTGQPVEAYVNFVFQPLFDADQQPSGLIAIGTEVTEQALARRQAEQQRRLLQGLFLEAPAPIAIMDGPEFVFQLVNPAYQHVFPGRELQDRPLLQALPELRDSPVPDLLRQVYRTGETYVAHELPIWIARTEGAELEEIFFTFTYQARHNARGQIDGVMVFAYDVTEQVRARQVVEASQRQTQALADELSQANARLTRANADLDNFVYTASHDLKAPITNIDGLLQALHQELQLPADQADTATVLRLMRDSVQRFQRTIKYLTDVTRWQHLPDEPVHAVALAPLVEDVRLDLAPLLAITGGVVELAPDSCPTIAFAEKHLRSLLYNLLSNALKYRFPDRPPVVAVRCYPDPAGAAVLEVHDNGLGLTDAQLERVFGMFQRLHDHVEGSGIGLYLVKQLAERFGGRVEVESQLGVGSIFRVVLPQAMSQTA